MNTIDRYAKIREALEAGANAALIAACDPDTIRELLVERDALAAENERLRTSAVRWSIEASKYAKKLDKAREREARNATIKGQDEQLFALRKWRQEYVGKLTIAEAALAEKDKEIAALREALREAAAALDQAREDVACWGSYAGEYFRDKHDLEGDLDRLAKQASAARAALKEASVEAAIRKLKSKDR